MLVEIDKIIVNDRIRKDFGNLEELAEDIRQNTLLNALVVMPSGNGDGTYVLIAGERRLRAMRDILGYTAVPVNTVGAESDEHALLMEISENECRKEFTKTERLDYARRLARIEAAKAKERMIAGKAQNPMADLPQGATRDIVASQLGTSATQLRQEQFIEDNRDLLDPEDFAEWDEGKLSTNRVFKRIKAEQAQAIKERNEANRELVEVRQELESAYHATDEVYDELASERGRNIELGSQIADLKRQIAEGPKPEVVEREIEVVPDDVQRRVSDLEGENERLNREYQKMWHKKMELDRKLEQANEMLGEKGRTREAQRDIEHLTLQINKLLRQHGGKAWAFDQFYRVDELAQKEFENAITNLAAFAQNLTQMIREKRKLNGNQ